MTTAIAQNTPENTAREKLPPVEHGDGPAVDVTSPAANDESYKPDASAEAANDSAFTHGASIARAPEPTHEANPEVNGTPGDTAKSVARWIHKHPQAHKHGVGVWVYQFVRSAVASVPYGLSMAGVLAGFTWMEKKGAHIEAKAASNFGKRFGNGLAGFAKFPAARTAALVGTSFTLYRGTSKLGKWLTEYLFNPKDSEQRTAEKVDDLVPEAWRKIKEIAPAESSSTPISAVVLGFIVTAFQKPYNFIEKIVKDGKTIENKEIRVEVGKAKQLMNIDWTRENFLKQQGWGNKFKLLGASIVHPKSKFLSQAAINTFGYAIFFELGDRLFKDVQIRRGVWPGEHNSIKALKAAPDEYEQGIKEGNDAANKPKFEDSALAPVPDKHHYSFFNSEPSLGRFAFRRLLPTAVGITAYTAFKMRHATMLGNNFSYDKGITTGQFFKKAWGEGAATSLFFLIPIVTEPWEKIYDTFWEKKEKIAQKKDHSKAAVAKHLTPLQEQNYETLLGRVNAKEAANDGKYSQRA